MTGVMQGSMEKIKENSGGRTVIIKHILKIKTEYCSQKVFEAEMFSNENCCPFLP